MSDEATHETYGPERLLRLERMMTDAYDAALGKVHGQQLEETLASFRKHHQRNAQALQRVAAPNGGDGAQLDPQFKRYLVEVLDTIDDAVRRDESIGELRIAEAALGMVYGQVLSETDDEQVASTIEECMKMEAEHLGVLVMAHEAAKT